ncbi:MAG: PAS domain S-box protein [Pseudomonadota bacterium]
MMTGHQNNNIADGDLEIALRNAVIDQALDCVVIIDGDGGIIEFNPAACRTFGYRREDTIGRNLSEILVPERFRQMHNDGMERYKRTGEGPVIGTRIEIEALCADGTEIPVELAITPVECCGEHYFTAYLRDISLRLTAETEIKNSQNKYQNLFDLSSDAIVVHTLDGIIVETNGKATEILGRSREDLIGCHVKDLHPEDALEASRNAMERVLAGEDVRIETVFVGPGGRPFSAELSARRVETDEADLVHGVVRDISERKRHEAERERYQKLLAHSQRLAQVGSYEWTVETDELLWSKEAYAIFGLNETTQIPTLKEYKGRVHPDDRAFIDTSIKRVIETGEPYEVSHRIILDDGSTRVVEGRGEAIRDKSGQTIKIVGTLQDITRVAETNEALTKAKEEAEAANIAKSHFLASMSHEMRTPLNGVIGLLDLLGETELTAEQTDYLETASASADALLTLLSDLLDLSRIEAGEMDIEVAPVRTAEFVEQSLEIVKATFENQQPTIRVAMHEGLPARIEADGARLRQVLTNLLSNAVKFTPDGEICVACDYDSAHGLLSISVEDQGIGIAPDKLSTLFDRFTQAHTGLSRRYGGAGLGLAITKHLVTLMGGTIHVDSRLGQGSRFTISIPASVIDDQPTPERSTDGIATTDQPLQGLSILLAEDSDTNALVVTRKLQARGAKVDRAVNGREAIDFVEARSYDAVLMDVSMPEVDGLTATRCIRQKGGAFAVLPIIALTAHALRGDKERCLAVGMTDYVAKPIALAKLMEAIMRHANNQPKTGTPILSPNEAAVDWEDDQELFADVLNAYEGELRACRTRLARTQQDADTDSIAREAHSLKSSAGNVGALHLQQLAVEIDALSKDNRQSDVTVLLPKLLDVIDETIDAIVNEKKGLAS